MNMPKPISGAEYGDLLGAFKRSAFRMDMVSRPASADEAAAFGTFLAGSPVRPPEVGWWKSYLETVAAERRQGRTRTRVRIMADPPTDYQRWLLWAGPWYAEAGEDIRYMQRGTAERIGLPLPHDWWLLDDERVIVMRFADDGHVQERLLVTTPEPVASYRLWRDIAVRNATPAKQIAAA